MIEQSKHGINDPKLFQEIQEHAKDLERMYTERNRKFDEYEEAFLLKWIEANNKKFRRRYQSLVQSPDARNQVLGAVRLLIAAEPTFTVSALKPSMDFDPDKVERWMTAWWDQCDKMSRRPLLPDIALSGVLYGEMHQGVTPMSALVDRAGKHKARVERRMKQTPVLIETWNPKQGYPEFDQFDLSAYYRTTNMTFADLKNRFGDMLPEGYTKDRYSTCTLSYFVDLDYTCYWVDGKLIYMDEHGYDDIPISVTLTDGSMLFDKPEDQRQPLLYGVTNANITHQQHLAMTVFYNVVYGLGANALFKHVAPGTNPGKRLELNFDDFGGVVEMEPGEDFAPVINRNLIPPEFMEAYRLAVEKGNDSTIYPQAFGAPVNRNTTFSEVSLLAQSGRLPLVTVQKTISMGIGKTIELALMVLKKDGRRIEFNDEKIDIPDDIQVEVNVEAKLPQDKLQLANIAHILKADEVADDEWIQNNILNIQDSKKTRYNIWKQNTEKAIFMAMLQQNLQNMMANKNPVPPQMGGQGIPQGQTMPQGMPDMPPEMPPAAPTTLPGQGEMTQGLPPQMAGMVPGAGEGMMPPEEEFIG